MRLPTTGSVQLFAICAASFSQSPPPARAFDTAVAKVITKSCVTCGNNEMAAGTLDIMALSRPASLAFVRESWERVLQKVKDCEMPPPGMPKPSEANYDRMPYFRSMEFERQDRTAKPDPERITARRLNRAEYRNTVRDLLDGDFQTLNEFQVDDSGAGFDNIGETLTVSPLLVDKYIDAAKRVANRQVGLAKAPPKPIQAATHRGAAISRGGGTLKPGRRMVYRHETPFCNLHMSLMDCMGVEVESFGDPFQLVPLARLASKNNQRSSLRS